MLIMNRPSRLLTWLPVLATTIGLATLASSSAQDASAPAKSLVYPLDVSVAADAKTKATAAAKALTDAQAKAKDAKTDDDKKKTAEAVKKATEAAARKPCGCKRECPANNGANELQAARDHKKNRIIPRHIQLAVRNDEELNKFLGGVTVAQGGVLPNIHPVLLPKKKKCKSSKSLALSGSMEF